MRALVISLFILSSTIISCGDGSYTVETKETTATETSEPESGTIGEKSDEDKQTVVGTPDAKRALIYYPKLVSWQQAVDNTPQGFELVSRVTALTLIESGEIYNYLPRDVQFWSASELKVASTFAWLIDLTHGETWQMLKISTFPALYIQLESLPKELVNK